MIEVTPTPEEVVQECFADTSLNCAMTAIREDGIVVINNVVNHAHLDILRGRMEADLQLVRALPVVPHNFVWGNIQQDPPPHAEFVFRDVLANPFVCQVTRALLGSGAFKRFSPGTVRFQDTYLFKGLCQMVLPTKKGPSEAMCFAVCCVFRISWTILESG